MPRKRKSAKQQSHLDQRQAAERAANDLFAEMNAECAEFFGRDRGNVRKSALRFAISHRYYIEHRDELQRLHGLPPILTWPVSPEQDIQRLMRGE